MYLRSDRNPHPAGNLLSERESPIAALFAVHALTNKQIAERLDLSIKTIEEYWRRIAVKTGIRSIPKVRRELLIQLGKASQ